MKLREVQRTASLSVLKDI